MKKIVKMFFSLIMAAAVTLSAFSLPAAAASYSFPSISSSKPIKCYTISTSNNTKAYSSTTLKTQSGTIYASDELYVYKIGKNSGGTYYAQVSYPVTGSSKRKTAYIKLSVITSATAPTAAGTSSKKITTYRRASSSSSAGYISSGDTVYKLAASGSYVQVLYNIGSSSSPTGWRMAWITKSNYNNYISSSNNTDSVSWPMKSAYCTWSTPGSNYSWGSYTKNSSGRCYHLGCDLYGSSGTVYSIAAGTVAAVGTNSANGNFVIIKHTISGKTVYSFYAHLKNYTVKKGASVSAGTKIGTAGNTGSSSSGTHLHLAIVNTLKATGSYYGYSTKFTGNKTTYSGVTYYNPYYVIKNNKLPS